MEKPGYVTGFEVFIFPEREWEKLKIGPNEVRYMRRTIEYNDWERILREYSTQIDEQRR
jgi:hypothetical protein